LQQAVTFQEDEHFVGSARNGDQVGEDILIENGPSALTPPSPSLARERERTLSDLPHS
jgi:hypothetical protein